MKDCKDRATERLSEDELFVNGLESVEIEVEVEGIGGIGDVSILWFKAARRPSVESGS